MLPDKFDIIIPPQDITCEPNLQQRLAAGDSAAFAWVYKNYCKRIYNYVLLFTGDETTSEDIVQDVFIKLWRYKERIDEVENFNAYLYRLAKNHMVDIEKKNANRKELLHRYHEGLPVINGGAADELINFKETQQLIIEVINNIPRKQQIVFVLREQGLKRPAIAAKLGKSEFTIRGRLSRAMNHLRKKLQINK